MTMYSIKPEPPSRPGWQILRLAGIPFIVEPSFLLFIGIAFLFVLQTWGLRLVDGLLICFIIFFSLLVHEGGHAFMARLLGQRGISVSLVMFGGNTTHPAGTRGQDLLITMAGPAGTLLLVAASWAAQNYLPASLLSPAMEFLLFYFFYLNRFWAIFNLIPIYPMDGGQIVFHSLSFLVIRHRALLWTAYLSVGICAVAALWALRSQDFIIIFFIGTFLMQNVRIIQGLRRR